MPWHGSSAVAKWGGSKYGDTRRQSRVERWEMAASAEWDIALGPIDFHDVMLTEYIDEALRRARYELIEDEETPYYGEVPELPGVWASGRTLEDCRRELKEVIEGWILVSVRRSLDLPRLGRVEIREARAA